MKHLPHILGYIGKDGIFLFIREERSKLRTESACVKVQNMVCVYGSYCIRK